MTDREKLEAARGLMSDVAAYLSNVAMQLDAWAVQSRSGGWSTHQVEGNIALANSARRMADQLRQEAA